MSEPTTRFRVETDGCDCGQVHGFRITGPGMRPMRLMGRLAADHGARLLNAGAITPHDLHALMGVLDSDIQLSAAHMRLNDLYANHTH